MGSEAMALNEDLHRGRRPASPRAEMSAPVKPPSMSGRI